jgi:tetratricopeptide (TPR) repeat protein
MMRGLATGLLLGTAAILTIAPAWASPQGEEIRRVEVTLQTDCWRIAVPFGGLWNHWSMNTPARIVIDMSGAQSRLPNAPALYTLDLPSGPVKRLRTSQYSSQPGKRCVRITLVLDEALRYEANEAGGGVDLRIPRPAGADWGALHRLIIEPGGVRTETLPARLPAEKRPEPPRPERSDEPPLGPAWLDSTGEASLEELLSDTTFFLVRPQVGHLAWNIAAARLLDEAQNRFLEGDSATCVEKLETCDRFYSGTDAGAQAAVLRRLLYRAWGRVVEAELGSQPTGEGPWPLLADRVFQVLLRDTQATGDLVFAAEILRTWGKANPDRRAWARGCMGLAELLLDAGEGRRAAGLIAQALAANPELEASPRALLMHSAARMEVEDWETAEKMLLRVERSASGDLQYRALAMQGDLYYRRQQHKRAAEFYERLLTGEVPQVERDWALFQLGNCWAELGDPGKARAYLQRAIEHSEESFWAPFARMRLLDLEDGRVAFGR